MNRKEKRTHTRRFWDDRVICGWKNPIVLPRQARDKPKGTLVYQQKTWAFSRRWQWQQSGAPWWVSATIAAR
jgi:hypothetical protein